jgi:hypothetical protein
VSAVSFTVVLSLAAAATVAAQPAVSLSDLGRHLRSGDRIVVLHADSEQGEQTEGRFLRVTPDAVSVLVEGRQRDIPAKTVLRIDKPDPVWNGALIGAAVLGVPGMAAAGASCSPTCAKTMTQGAIFFAAVGAGIGALVDGVIRGYSPVYIADAFAPATGRVEPAPPAGVREAVPPGGLSSLDQLAIHVKPRDKIEVVTTSGRSTTGLFLQSSADSVTLLVEGRFEQISATGVHRVNRIGHQAAKGAMYGMLAGVVIGATGSAEGGGGVIQGLYLGTLWGAVIGRAISSRTLVYEQGAGPSTVSLQFIPWATPTRAGLALSVSF